jgi:hypothetical protein
MTNEQVRLRLRQYRDELISFGTLAALLGWIIGSDNRMFDQLSRRLNGVWIDMLDTGAHAGDTTSNLMSTMQASMIELGPMWAFAGLAVILTVWMLRS